MAKKKNQYIKKARMAQVMKAINGQVDTKGKLGTSAMITVKDVVIAVLGGNVIASVVGIGSFPIGLIVTCAGHYTNSKLLQSLGIGTMASTNFSKTTTTVNGLEGLAGVKERLQALKESWKEKFFLDKILKKKELSGIGEVQYFTYPNDGVGDLAALDSIENQLIESGIQFQGAGAMGHMAGMEDDFGDIEALNY